MAAPPGLDEPLPSGPLVSGTPSSGGIIVHNPNSPSEIGVPALISGLLTTTSSAATTSTETPAAPKSSDHPPAVVENPTPSPSPSPSLAPSPISLPFNTSVKVVTTTTTAADTSKTSTKTDAPTFETPTTTRIRTTVTLTPSPAMAHAAANLKLQTTTRTTTSQSFNLTTSTTTARTRSATLMKTSTEDHSIGTSLSFATETPIPSAVADADATVPGDGASDASPTASKGANGKTGKAGAEGTDDEVGHKSADGDVNIGIIIGIVAAILVVIGIGVFAWSKWRKAKKKKEELQMLNDEDDLDDSKSEFSSGRPAEDRQTWMTGMSGDSRARGTLYADYDTQRSFADTELLDGKSYRYDIDRDTLVTKAPRSTYWAGPETGRTGTTAFTNAYTPWHDDSASVPPVPQMPSAFSKKDHSQAKATTRPMTEMSGYGGLLSAYGDATAFDKAKEADPQPSRPSSMMSTMTENLLPWLKKEPDASQSTTTDAFAPQGRSHKPSSRPISFRRLTGERVSNPPTAPPPVRPPPVPAMAQTPMAVTTRLGGYDGPMPAFR